ncbi:MAG: ATP-binding cassette domain-containing protein, partial [Anaerolineae bacterium]|nr:ATP-binding cassette domain-containing protein [Anaerolineae bacterium]
MANLLQVENLSKAFGGILAVNNVSFTLESGTILGVIGPNGSGKTTLLNLLNGVHRPDEGSISFVGQMTTNLPSHQLTKQGIMRTFQNPHVFSTITAYQNMMVPLLHSDVPAGEAHEKAMSLLAFINLADKA